MGTLVNNKNISLIIARLLIGFYFVYNVFFIKIGFFVPRLSIMVLMLAGFITFFSSKVVLSKDFKYLIVFIVYAFFSGHIVALNDTVVINKTLFLIESVFAGIIVYNVVKDTKDIYQLTALYAIGALLCALYFYRHTDLLIATRLSFDEDFNSNTLGVMLTYGIWCIIFTLNYKKISLVKITVTIILVLIVFFILVQTGSRKSVIGTLLMSIFYLGYVLLIGGGNKINLIYKLVITISVIGLLAFLYFKYIDSFLDAADTFFNRMENVEGSEERRSNIIIDSFNLFLKNPLFGVGLDNVRYYTFEKMYSHNSYVEALACTGIIGAFFIFVIFWHLFMFFIKNVIKVKNYLDDPSKLYVCALILFYLLLCIVQINFYNRVHMYFTYIMLSYINITAKNEKSIIRVI